MVTHRFVQERRLMPLPFIAAFVLLFAAYFVASQVIALDGGVKAFAETVGIAGVAVGLLLTVHRVVTIWTVDADGICMRVESRLKSFTIRGRDILSIPWSDVADVSLEPNGGMKITPIEPQSFRKTLLSLSVVKLRLRLDENGAFVAKQFAAQDALLCIEAWHVVRAAA